MFIKGWQHRFVLTQISLKNIIEQVRTIRLRDVVPPLDTAGVVSHEDKAGINGRGGVEGVLESFAILNEKGYLPRYDVELSYWIEQPPSEALPTRARVPALAVMA